MTVTGGFVMFIDLVRERRSRQRVTFSVPGPLVTNDGLDLPPDRQTQRPRGTNVKKLTALLLLAVPAVSYADYGDVIAGKFSPGCNMASYMPIVKYFNEAWAKDYRYRAEILMPVQSESLATFY